MKIEVEEVVAEIESWGVTRAIGHGLVQECVQRMRALVKEPEHKLYCPTCGADDCEMVAWCMVNVLTYVDGDPPDDDVYCPSCEEHMSYGDLVDAPPSSDAIEQMEDT